MFRAVCVFRIVLGLLKLLILFYCFGTFIWLQISIAFVQFRGSTNSCCHFVIPSWFCLHLDFKGFDCVLDILPMPIVRFHCPFAGLSGCRDGGVNGLTMTSLIRHLRDRHCNGEAQAFTKHSLVSDLVVF